MRESLAPWGLGTLVSVPQKKKKKQIGCQGELRKKSNEYSFGKAGSLLDGWVGATSPGNHMPLGNLGKKNAMHMRSHLASKTKTHLLHMLRSEHDCHRTTGKQDVMASKMS